MIYRTSALLLVIFLLGGCNTLEKFNIRPLLTNTADKPDTHIKNKTAADKQTASLTAQANKPDSEKQKTITTTHGTEPVIRAVAPQKPQPQKKPAVKSSEPKLPSIPIDIWERLRKAYKLRDYNHAQVKSELSWYARHPEYLDRVSIRAEPFLHYILTEVERRKLPGEIALLPIVESAFQPFAYSHGRAAGIWQFIPGTGRRFGLKQNWWYDGRRDIVQSTKAALEYLEYLNRLFDGNWLHALAAYNSGEGTVKRAIRKNKKKGKPTDFWHLDLPDETRSYVPKLLAISAIISNPAKYNIQLRDIPDSPKIRIVKVGSQIDLALAAKLAEISLEKIYQLNPGFNRWATDPTGPHHLLIPADREDQFKQQLAKLPANKRIRWKRHKIRNGEAISTIAKRYQTTTQMLRRVNGLRNNRIRAGKHLIIPVATRSLQQYSLSLHQRQKARLSKKVKGHKLIYTVKRGDTFWDLSRKYRVSVIRLAKWNGMAPADTLQPGKKLLIRVKNRKSAKATARLVRVNHRLPAATIRPIIYKVRKGDSLARISTKFNVSISQLRKWNRLKKGKYLQPGQKLRLYIDVTKQT